MHVYVRELLFQYVKERREFRALAIEIESAFQSLLRRLSLKLTANLRHKKSRRNR